MEKAPTILFRHQLGPIAQSNDGRLIVYPGTILHMECLWMRKFGLPSWNVSHNYRLAPIHSETIPIKPRLHQRRVQSIPVVSRRPRDGVQAEPTTPSVLLFKTDFLSDVASNSNPSQCIDQSIKHAS